MDVFQALFLGLLQGLTEFLPISSSAHLILLPMVAEWEDQGLAFDVAVHVGSLAAVVTYFRRELATMARDWFASVVQRRTVGESRLAWAVLWGTVPVGLAGLVFKGFIEGELRGPLVIATTTVVFGLALWWADARGSRQRDEHALRWRDVLIVGLAQAIALIPGTSRSGITMTAGLLVGLSREAAARFSFLLSIPVIILAGGLKGVDLVTAARPVDWSVIAVGTAMSAVSAYLCIAAFLAVIQRIGMLPFVIYRLVLGAILFALFAG